MLNHSISLNSFTNGTGAEVNQLLDSDDEDGIEVLPTPKAKQSLIKRTYDSPTFALLDDDEEYNNTQHEDSDKDSLPDLADASLAILSAHSSMCFQATSRAASTFSTTYDTHTLSTASTSIPCIKRKVEDSIYHTDEEKGLEADSLPKKKRAKKDPEQVRLEKEAKAQARKAAAEEKKREKAETAERKKLERAQEKGRKEAERVQQKEQKGLNKLVNSRNDTLKHMTIEFSPALLRDASPLLHAIPEVKTRIVEESKGTRASPSWPITTFQPEPPLSDMRNLVRWKRWIVAKYNDEDKEWQAIETPYSRLESAWLLYYTLKDVAGQVQNPHTERISQSLSTLRTHLGPRRQIYMLIDHSGNQWARLPLEMRARVEARLAELQVEHNCFVIRAQDSEDLVRRFFDLTADLSIKPYKLIERSHLAFCSQVKKSDCIGVNGSAKIYHRMLQQIYRITDPIVESITQDSYPTLRSLIEAYEQPGMTDRQRENLFIGVSMGNNRKVGSVLSSRIAAVFTGEDSLALVGK
ncbi:hypothetical protein FRB95_010454 [Tulasnella sp. JGI-2019a]|nr:hypothetical protein FRB95_010454 [Tulasnella sp. JGI-2019a]